MDRSSAREPVRVCGILVTFHPTDEDLGAVLRAAQPQLDGLVVVDNSTDPAAVERVDRALAGSPSMRSGGRPTRMERQGNLGLSRALNRGLEEAIRQGYDRFLLLDQDSVLAEGAVAELSHSEEALSRATGPVLLAARNDERAPTRLQRQLEEVFYGYGRPEPPRPRAVPLAMTSGLFLTVPALQAVGPFDETLFLDSVDHEFCLRARRRGIPLYLVPTARVGHALGHPRPASWGPFEVTLRGADELRLYYSTRDTLRTAFRYLYLRPLVCGTLIAYTAGRSAFYGLLRRQEPSWFRAICRGWLDFPRAAAGTPARGAV